MMYYGYNPLFGGFNWLGGLLMAFFWILIVVAIIAIVRSSRAHRFDYWHRMQDGDGSSSKALDILDERYAKGEIGKEEYEAKKSDIAKKP
ncbi:MAG: SHOCT domain-containing protein [Patescibacteria group bacterium]|nr:SHOCT domain-containing protein [Patescibacteria group bacterium]